MDQIAKQAVIDADRFVLRPVRKRDIGAIELFTSDERVANACRSIPHPLPPGATEAFVGRAMAEEREADVWVMDQAGGDTGGMVGMITLARLGRAQSELSYWVAPALWNSGIASEAVRALMAANPLKSREVFASVFQDNPASARVLTNAGFAYLGDAEAFSVARDNTVPTWTYMKKMG